MVNILHYLYKSWRLGGQVWAAGSGSHTLNRTFYRLKLMISHVINGQQIAWLWSVLISRNIIIVFAGSGGSNNIFIIFMSL